jgi:hypothetical protein
MRYTGEEKKKERDEAAIQLKDVWGKLRGSFNPGRGSGDSGSK